MTTPGSGPSFETKPFYRTPADEAAVHALYDEARAALPFPTDERTVGTRLGDTHLLVAGPEGAPDVVVLQGGNMVSPLTTAWMAPLADRVRIWAPDTPGQPGRSANARPVDGEALGPWLVDVLDGLGLERPAFVAFSAGVEAFLELAAFAPERVARAALVVPSGIVGTPIGGMLRLTAGYLSYRLRPSDGTARATLRVLTGGPEPDPLMVRATALAFGGTELETRTAPPAVPERLAGLTAPVLVLAGEHDPMFPARRVLERAPAIFPNLVAAEAIPGAHLQDADGVRRLGDRLAPFLLGGDR